MKFRPFVVAAFGVALLAGLTACQTGVTMWDTCSPAADGNPTGTDGQYVLVCKDGTWEPIMTVEEFVAASRGEDVTIAPLPVRPAATTTTTTTTTVAPSDPWVAAEGTCFTYFGSLSFRYDGPKDTFGNAPLFLNGTCSGTPAFPDNSFVEASSTQEASSICNAIKPPDSPDNYTAASPPGLNPAFPFPNVFSCRV